MKNKELIKLTDGALMNIEYEDDYIAGCPTCDYGSVYINEYTFVFSETEKLVVKVDNMYDYFFSESDMMHIILPNIDLIKTMSKRKFCDWIVDNIQHNKEDKYDIPDNVYAVYYNGEDFYAYEEG